MAQSETHCSDNFGLNTGPTGPIGATGPAGATGPVGVQGPQGIQGQSVSKVDIAFQSTKYAYADIISNQYSPIGYFIYDGTDLYTPAYIKFGLSLLATSGTTTLSVRVKSIAGTSELTILERTIHTTNGPSTHSFSVNPISTFANLPATETIFEVSAKIDTYVVGTNEARLYTLEMK